MATGFPAGQTHLKTRLEEIRLAVEDGATEIDVVLSRTLVLTGKWEGECRHLVPGAPPLLVGQAGIWKGGKFQVTRQRSEETRLRVYF